MTDANPKKRHWSLSQQLLLGFGSSIITVGLVTLGVNYRLIRQNLDTQVRVRAMAITETLEFSAESLIQGENITALNRMVQNYSTLPAVVEIFLLNPQGQTLAQGPNTTAQDSFLDRYPHLIPQVEAAMASGTTLQVPITINGRPALVTLLPFSSTMFGSTGGRGAAIAVLDLNQLQQDAQRTFTHSTLTLLLGATAILMLMGMLVRRLVLQPIEDLKKAVEASKETGTFTMPAALSSHEIHFLGRSFDKVFRQLEAYNQLQIEIAHRQKVEAGLRESETRERSKSKALEQALQEMQHMQMHMVQSEKMSSLGQLVAGVAHEINNPVNFIYGNLSHADEYIQDLLTLIRLYQTHYPDPDPVIQDEIDNIDLEFLQTDLPKLLQSMQVGASRIRDIVKSLRVFSRMDESEVKEVDLHEGIDSTLMILQNRLKARPEHPAIQVVRDYGQIPPVECSAGQLNQVFMNLLCNAIDALEETMATAPVAAQNGQPSAPPTITIRTEPVDGQRVRIQVQDNGSGIPKNIRNRLFDPFFTTKPVGRGTGMGLSISQEIVVGKHGGQLTCDSIQGQGATFGITIPLRFKGKQTGD
ncbi:sensor histidine kinase [Leptolyngbya sp. PCC 6406]|uniref:sensor histidine kinase n=1 Tax=Leptolyngbya sp. PCC 6406 TaxID=1173264 RepID=UPI0002AC6B9C|nr:ATP-binding protein [Leptolyngbya sp. PCC 6406]